MAWTLTPWGYEVDGTLAPLLSAEQFAAMTDGAYLADARVEFAIDACTSAIRKHCGWHVAGSASCRATLDGGGRSLWLPANHVQTVTHVTVCGTEVTAYEWNRMGLVRVPHSPDRLRCVVIEYQAGYATTPDDLAEFVKNRVEQALIKSPGVTQETAGSVSISYAQAFAMDFGSGQFGSSDLSALASYRLAEAM
jgi:hypothetical protein